MSLDWQASLVDAVVYVMRLERLEINGFKSFSDRSELAFDTGVTAIVGPNGCGKSNVADAITWVMGEQSARSLRGDRMEDVIFNGSDARKPTAAAEVRLRLKGVPESGNGAHGRERASNGDGSGHATPGGNGHRRDGAGHEAPGVAPDDPIHAFVREVEVIRRLYRSGESEYLIDGRVCRLRDVHDLLMDTGLGAKAYAIIEQGKIGMILGARPSDRRQLIEEAAGVTRYKSRRRAAELKLDAARQNLTRIDDIVFEVDKQRGALKRQAARARRHQRLLDELRRWEKVLLVRRYRQLADAIESARDRLAGARAAETVEAARVAEIEVDLGRLRIELVAAETAATEARGAAHARELAINRQQQQMAFDREQVVAIEHRIGAVASELDVLAARRHPAQAALAERRAASAESHAERDRAAEILARESASYELAHREIEGLEADVEAARSEVFSAINAATALRHALEHAAAARDRVAETLDKLHVEQDDIRVQQERTAAERAGVMAALGRARDVIEATRATLAARESELASARAEHDWRDRAVRSAEQELARLEARLTSLEELEAARAGFSDAARAVLAQANGRVSQQGAIADYLEVEAGYERAVEAHLGDLLQHAIVERPEQAAAGFDLVGAAGIGRCGFLIAPAAGAVDAAPLPEQLPIGLNPSSLIPLSSVVRVNGPFAGAIRRAMGEAWVAPSYGRAAEMSGQTTLPVLTSDGTVFHGPQLVTGGWGGDQVRGILESRREVKELGVRLHAEREAFVRLAEETVALEASIAQASSAIDALHAGRYTQEKAIVGFEAQRQHLVESEGQRAQKAEQLARERRQAEGEHDAIDRRREEAHASIIRLQSEQREADDRLTLAQRRLFEAREAAEDLSRRAADRQAAHAALAERAAALVSEVRRLEESAADLDARTSALRAECDEGAARAHELSASIVAGEAALGDHVGTLDRLRADVEAADDLVARLRTDVSGREDRLKTVRGALDAVRALGAELDVARATAESDLSHLAASCLETVHAPLDTVAAEVEELERTGDLTPDARVICAELSDEPAAAEPEGGPAEAAGPALTAEEAVTRLREKIDRLGPINMMAIEQFDELDTRHAFLTTERADLVRSIAQTTEAITRIDETTRQRFGEAFSAINGYFQETFCTLFGGGRAGLALVDDTDPLECGIDIIAQPPGKRLQNVQLLSGGEKALTAIALMFGMFRYRPSPFCVLDEIDAPLDDANIGRFIEMLRGMQQHTQFIVITHNRKTMEIADRLYGVTMEEPGVSKLISVQLN